nr:hypothetical protein CFP56_02825 [Quercus suber]
MKNRFDGACRDVVENLKISNIYALTEMTGHRCVHVPRATATSAGTCGARRTSPHAGLLKLVHLLVSNQNTTSAVSVCYRRPGLLCRCVRSYGVLQMLVITHEDPSLSEKKSASACYGVPSFYCGLLYSIVAYSLLGGQRNQQAHPVPISKSRGHSHIEYTMHEPGTLQQQPPAFRFIYNVWC